MKEKEFGERENFLSEPTPHHQPRDNGNMGSVLSQLENNPGAAVLAYCFSSISMTVVNKYVVSGSSWSLNFLYLAIQVGQLSNMLAPRQDLTIDTFLFSIVHDLHGCNSGSEEYGHDT